MRSMLLLAVVVASGLTACGSHQDASLLTDDRASGPFPLHPDEDLTPGTLCDRPDSHRYPERIAYCERDVSTSTKRSIIAEYDSTFGYRIGSMNRQLFKIDHYIPLCMGGSNARSNLWPQHESVFQHTDPIEQKLCELMAQGDLTQAEAVAKIRHVKFHIEEAGAMIDELDEALGH